MGEVKSSISLMRGMRICNRAFGRRLRDFAQVGRTASDWSLIYPRLQEPAEAVGFDEQTGQETLFPREAKVYLRA